MHVLHCVPAFSPLTQTFIYNLVSRLPRYGTLSSVMAWERTNPEARPFEPFHRIPRPSNNERIWCHLAATTRPWIALPHTPFERQVRRTLAQIRPDCVHAQFGSVAAWIHRACAEQGVPLIVTFRGKDASEKLHKGYWERTYQALAQNAAAITAVSEDLAKGLQSLLPESANCQVIFSGVNPNAIPFQEPAPPQGRLLSVGRLVEKKGHDDAIRALARVRQMGVDAHLVIIGEGHAEERAALCQLSEEQGVAPYVELRGARPHEEVLAAYRQADLLIAACRTGQTGDREGVPNVLKEAQLSGLPVVATRHGGIPSAIPPRFRGELVAEGDAAGLAERIRRLLGQPREQLYERALSHRDYICTHFSTEAEIEAYQRLYHRCCATRSPTCSNQLHQ